MIGGPRPRRSTALALVGALVLSVLTATTGAEAKEGGSGLDLDAAVTLPQFPCPDPDGAEPCSGTLSGQMSGSLSGDHDGRAWSFAVVDATVETVGDNFSYGDDAANPCVAGSASGTLHVTADGAHTLGAYEFEEPAKAPRPIDGLDMTADFSWERVGTTLGLELHDAVVLADVGGLGWLELVSAGQGGGDGTLTIDLEPAELPDCVFVDDTPEVTAALEGSVSFTEDRRPAVPTLVSPDPDDSPTFTFGNPSRFTVNATDPDGDPYTARISVVDGTTGAVVEKFETHPAPSGVDASGRPDDPIPPGQYEWFAVAVDVRGAAGPESQSGQFTVASASATSSWLDPAPSR